MEKCIWKQSPKSPSIGSFSFFPFLGREEGTFTENQCGVVDGTPHRLWSSVLAGGDNYTAVCNKVSKQRNIFYTTFSTEISARVSWERSTPDHFSVVWRFNLLFYLKSTQNKKQSHWTLRNSSDLQRYQRCISPACIPSFGDLLYIDCVIQFCANASSSLLVCLWTLAAFSISSFQSSYLTIFKGMFCLLSQLTLRQLTQGINDCCVC